MEKEKVTLPKGFSDLGEPIKSIDLETIPSKDSTEKVHYPCLYFSGKESLKGLPKSGTAMIHFKKVMEREEQTTRNGETKKSYSVELQIHGIKPMDSEESPEMETEEEESDETAIDKGLEAAEESTEEKED